MTDNKSEKLNDEKEKIKKLSDKKLLIKTIKEVQKKGVVGEEDTIMVLCNKITMRKVKNSNPTSSNVVVSDETGGGKDHVVKNTCEILVSENEYYHRTDISDKTFDYWKPLKPMDEWDIDEKGKKIPTYDSWDGHVIHLEDPRENALDGQSFKVMSSGGTSVTKVIDFKAVDIKIEGKPVFIVTSLKTLIDIEGIRRWDTKRIDTTVSQTKAINKLKLKKASGNFNDELDKTFIDALQKNIFDKNVIIPYAMDLNELLPDSILARTQTDKLLDAIKSSAVFHQHQREKKDNDTIIANGFDLAYGWYVFLVLNGTRGIPTNIGEEELVKILLKEDRPLSINELSSLFTKHTKQWIYDNKEKLVSKGLIKTFYEYEERANKDVEKIIIGDNSFLVLKGFNEVLKFADKRGFKGFKGFKEMCKDINNSRVNNSLKPIFMHVFVENLENLENLSIDPSLKPLENHFKTSLLDRIRELKKYCEKIKNSGHKISYTALCDNFDKSFIEKCKQNKVLASLPDGTYDFVGGE